MYKIVDSWLNTRKTQTSELLHISQNWLNFFHLISNFSWFPTFHILSVFANFFRIQIFWSIYFHKYHVSYIHTNCLFSATFWTRTGSKSLILTVFRKWFCIHLSMKYFYTILLPLLVSLANISKTWSFFKRAYSSSNFVTNFVTKTTHF